MPGSRSAHSNDLYRSGHQDISPASRGERAIEHFAAVAGESESHRETKPFYLLEQPNIDKRGRNAYPDICRHPDCSRRCRVQALISSSTAAARNAKRATFSERFDAVLNQQRSSENALRGLKSPRCDVDMSIATPALKKRKPHSELFHIFLADSPANVPALGDFRSSQCRRWQGMIFRAPTAYLVERNCEGAGVEGGRK